MYAALEGLEVIVLDCRAFGGQAGASSRIENSVQILTGEHIWLVSFRDYDLGYFDHETCKLEPLDNPFRPKVLPMSPE